MPELKTFRGNSMTDVLFKVKKDLGPSAVIVSTRSFKSGAVMGVGGKPVVEIVASAAAQTIPPRASLRDALARTYEDVPQRRSPQRIDIPRSTQPAFTPTRLHEGLNPPPPTQTPAHTPAPTPAPITTLKTTTTASIAPAPEAAPSARSTTKGPARLMPLPVEPDPKTPEAVDQLREELGSIKQMVSQLLRVSTHTTARASRERFGIAEAPMFENGSLPEPLFAHYTRLLDSGVDVPTAQTIIASVRDALGPSDLEHDARAVRLKVLEAIAHLIPCAALPAPSGDAPQVIALIGPTGVGKTTTIAKLAADHALRKHRRVALITADTYRIGAVDQLRAYAQIIGIPLHVAATPEDMTLALSRCADADIILIDTAGRSPSDHQRLDELAPILDAAHPAHRVLVLSAAASDTAIERTTRRFSDLNPDRIILSKLDEAVALGVCINAPR
ncbi:MAG TPA: flagellar biosynthesis protein FlhF, partial [Phycisphaerales bacterium]|nr:flagellar biosynthesis protein FlhF [Phycisphaerales bacterium]